MKIYMKNTVK